MNPPSDSSDRRTDWFGAGRLPFLTRRNYVLEMQHIFAWGMVVGVVEGGLASVVAAKTFGAGPLLISIAATTPFAAHIASLMWGALCEGRRKLRLFLWCATGVALCMASIAMTPHSSMGAVLFVVQMAAAQFFMSGTVTVRSALWRANYPTASRGQITARIQKARAVVRLAAVAGAAIIFDYQPQAYRWFYPLIALLAVVGALVLQRMRVRGESSELRKANLSATGIGASGEPLAAVALAMPRQVWSRTIDVLRRDPRFRRYMLAQFFAGSANFLVRAVLILVVTKQLLVDMRAEYWVSTMLLDGMTMIVMLASMSHFATYFDRVGVLRFRVAHGVLWTIALLLGMGGTVIVLQADRLGPMHLPLAVGMFALFSMMRGLCMGAGSLAWNLGHLHFARNTDAEVYMGIHVSLTGLRGLLLPGLGMAVWYTASWGVWIVAIAASIAGLRIFAVMSKEELAQRAIDTDESEERGQPSQPEHAATVPVGCIK